MAACFTGTGVMTNGDQSDRAQAEDALAPATDLSGNRIGQYLILRSLGIGGMGEVYLAERADQQFQQRVAIKVVRGGVLARNVQSRFKAERQILAQLDHPNIARLLDGGSLPDGSAYIVMEYVDGIAIDAYCDQHRLDLSARLRLFQTVCGAVHSAHQNLIVHRDLKPSNILVNTEGAPKLLDFGIAKLLDERQAVQHTLAMTHADFRVMTPDHASPEQVRGEPITTASDVYVLGVVLYELLTGTRPFIIPSLRLADIERVICEQEPARPSDAIGESPNATTLELAERRGVNPARLRRALQGDLDNIVLMAMRKEPARRYGSAQQMASDIQRHLDGMPVIARPDTFAYRADKFVRRNWIGVAAGALLFLITAAFAAITWRQSLHLAAERDEVAMQRASAERERARAEEVSDFLINLFKLSDPEENRGNQVTARELLSSGAQRLRTGLADQPATRAALLSTVGSVYNSLGLYADALPVLQESLALQHDADDHVRLATLLALGRARLGSSDLTGADGSLQDALRLAQSRYGAASLDTARALWELGELRHAQGRFRDAEGLYKRALGIFETQHASPTDVSWLLDDLGKIYEREQQWPLARRTYERALEIDRQLLGADHPRVAVHLHNLAFVMENLGDVRRAEELYRDAIQRNERAYGEHHPVTATAWGNYGLLLQRLGRLQEAESYLRRALNVMLQLYGPEHFDVAYNRVSLGLLLHDKGDLAGAESEYRQALAVYDKTLPPQHQWRASALMYLARLLAERGRGPEALQLADKSIAIWTATSPAGSPKTAQAHAIHGYALLQLGQAQAAAAELDAALPTLLAARGANDVFARKAQKWRDTARSRLPHAVQVAGTVPAG
jgi:eukaryotic-like serine/threonine-protein kinase